MNRFNPINSQNGSQLPQTVFYQRSELHIILSLYGRMVAAGEWRDYGISSFRDVAIVFMYFAAQRAQPLYRIEKRPKLRNKQGEYAVIGMDGRFETRSRSKKRFCACWNAN